MNRALATIIYLILFVVGVSLILKLTRHCRAKGFVLDGMVGGISVVLSFIFAGSGLLFAVLASSQHPGSQSVKGPSTDLFAFVPAAMFHVTALIVAIGLWLGAAFQLASSWRSAARDAQRQNAARLAIYGGVAFLVSIAHLSLSILGPSLLR